MTEPKLQKRHASTYYRDDGVDYRKALVERGAAIAAAHIILWAAHRLRAIGVRTR